jgi:hypothetical protein
LKKRSVDVGLAIWRGNPSTLIIKAIQANTCTDDDKKSAEFGFRYYRNRTGEWNRLKLEVDFQKLNEVIDEIRFRTKYSSQDYITQRSST